MAGCDGCGGCGKCCGRPLSDEAAAFLFALAQTPFLPAYRCALPDGFLVGPLYVLAERPSLSELLQSAESIGELARRGLVTVDFDIPLQNTDAADDERAAIRAHFFEAVSLESGSVALTARGQEATDELERTAARGCGGDKR